MQQINNHQDSNTSQPDLISDRLAPEDLKVHFSAEQSQQMRARDEITEIEKLMNELVSDPVLVHKVLYKDALLPRNYSQKQEQMKK